MSVREESIPKHVRRHVPADNPHLFPWYVVPNYVDGGISADIVNAEGSLVARCESIEEARMIVHRMNGEQA